MPKKLSEMTLEELWQLFPIFLIEHRDCWDAWYEDERRFLSSLLPGDVVLHHIGSTAIEGIRAKPIIDILAEIPYGTDMCLIRDILTANGYICMAQNANRISLNKGYTELGFAERVFHLHIRYEGDRDEVLFRDYLNTHPDAAKEYERLKLSLVKPFEHDRDGYTAAKSDFVARIMAKARETAP